MRTNVRNQLHNYPSQKTNLKRTHGSVGVLVDSWYPTSARLWNAGNYKCCSALAKRASLERKLITLVFFTPKSWNITIITLQEVGFQAMGLQWQSLFQLYIVTWPKQPRTKSTAVTYVNSMSRYTYYSVLWSRLARVCDVKNQECVLLVSKLYRTKLGWRECLEWIASSLLKNNTSATIDLLMLMMVTSHQAAKIQLTRNPTKGAD